MYLYENANHKNYFLSASEIAAKMGVKFKPAGTDENDFVSAFFSVGLAPDLKACLFSDGANWIPYAPQNNGAIVIPFVTLVFEKNDSLAEREEKIAQLKHLALSIAEMGSQNQAQIKRDDAERLKEQFLVQKALTLLPEIYAPRSNEFNNQLKTAIAYFFKEKTGDWWMKFEKHWDNYAYLHQQDKRLHDAINDFRRELLNYLKAFSAEQLNVLASAQFKSDFYEYCKINGTKNKFKALY